MSHPAKTVFCFGCYLVLLGLALALGPNLLLALVRLPPTSEVWIRVAGMLACFLGIYYGVAARAEVRPFFRGTVLVRSSVPLIFTAFVVARLAPPVLILFGLVDLAGALWTWEALRREATPPRP